MCRVMSNRGTSPWIALTGGFHLHERSDGCVLFNEHEPDDVMAGTIGSPMLQEEVSFRLPHFLSVLDV